MKKLFVLLGFVVVLALLLLAYTIKNGGDYAKVAEGKPIAAASFYVLDHFLEQVVGQQVTILDFLPVGVDAHSINLTTRHLAYLQDVDFFVFQGAGFDPWAERLAENLAAEGKATLEITSKFSLLQAVEEDEHEEEDDHVDGEFDPHIWLDPLLAQQEIKVLAEHLQSLLPEQSEAIANNAKAYEGELAQLHEEFQEGLVSCQLNQVIVSHNAFQYMADRYNFEIIPIAGLSPEAEASARSVGEIATLAKDLGIKHVFKEPLVNDKVVQTLADELGAEILVLNPIEGLTREELEAGEDYLSIMRKNLENLKVAMQCG